VLNELVSLRANPESISLKSDLPVRPEFIVSSDPPQKALKMGGACKLSLYRSKSRLGIQH